ncbi:MAG: tetratricopeptide repeat protein [Planctomycetes bacterium]|nr:tetratricopeptide repeat protein [Planctomycetota bacterium]
MPSAESAYLFRHALVRDAAYHLQPPGDRAQLHALVLEVAEALFEGDDKALDAMAAELVHHATAAQYSRRTADVKWQKELAAKEAAYLLRAMWHESREFHNEKAMEFGRRLADHPAATHDDRIAALLRIGETLLNTGRARDGREWFEKAASVAEAAGDGASHGRALRAIGISYARTEGNPPGIPYVERALEIFRKIGDRRAEGLALSNLSVMRVDSEPAEQTLAAYHEALAILTEADDENGRAATLSNIGNLLRNMARYDESAAVFEEALAIHRKRGERQYEAMVVGNLSGLYGAMGRQDESRAAAARALQIARETGDLHTQGVSLFHIGAAASRSGRLEEAEDAYKRGLQAIEECGARFWHAVLLDSYRILKAKQGKFEAAAKLVQEGREMFLAQGNEQMAALALRSLARIDIDARRPGEARKKIEQALEVIQRMGLDQEEGETRASYAVALHMLGDPGAEPEYRKARALFLSANALDDLEVLEKRWRGLA